MRTVAILPVKSFGRAKQRLEAHRRAELAAAMVADVLEALGRAKALDEILLVTREPSLQALPGVPGLHLRVVRDALEAGHSEAALHGIGAARADRVLLVPGDCPAVDPGEVDALLEGAEGGVTIVPDRHGTGTNALVLDPPGAIAPAFGPGSCERHRRLAEAAGVPVRVARVPSLALDVDTAADLDALLAERPEAAPRTRACLAAA